MSSIIKKLQKKYGKSIKFESLNKQNTMGQITEVTDKEINALRKLSKDVDKLKKDYLKIVDMGDKELKSSKLNKDNQEFSNEKQKIIVGAKYIETNILEHVRLKSQLVHTDKFEKIDRKFELIKQIVKEQSKIIDKLTEKANDTP